MNIGLIVEGHGEVQAAPVLIRNVCQWIAPDVPVVPLRPLRVPRGKLVKEAELGRSLELLAPDLGEDGGVVVLLDADDDLPCQLGPQLLGWARAARPDLRVGVVVASREYESWFLGSAASLRGVRGLPLDLEAPADVERSPRDPKGWLSSRMPNGYSETVDQAALTNGLDPGHLRTASASFDKLVRVLAGLLRVAPPSPTTSLG